MFDRIAPRYDLLNRLLSLGRDVSWRRRVSDYLPERNEHAVLDLATGTADLLISLREHNDSVTIGVGVDRSGEMLKIARRKIARRSLDDRLSVIKGDGATLPFGDGTFDAVTIAFGIRNFIDVPGGLSQMHGVLNDGGKALILEFSLPRNRLIRGFYLLYFRYILPVVGAVISGDRYAYRYLNRTVETFPHGQDFCTLMSQAGFVGVQAHPLTFGIATIYEGTRAARRRGSSSGKGAPDYDEAIRNMEGMIENTLKTTAAQTPGTASIVTRLEIEISDISPLHWLAATNAGFKFYWADRSGDFETAAVGVADSYDDRSGRGLSESLLAAQRTLESSEEGVRYYGGHRFDISRDPDEYWRAFGKYRFVLPRFEVTRCADGIRLACNLIVSRDSDKLQQILRDLSSLARGVGSSPDLIPERVSSRNVPDLAGWRKQLQSFMDQSQTWSLEKLVLARRTDIAFRKTVPALVVLERLKDTEDRCFHFYFQLASGVAFMGATPERLYRRLGSALECEAIAGTRPRGLTPEDDLRFAAQMRKSEKELREHRLVVESIKESLSSLCGSEPSFEGEPESILKLKSVQHLITRLSATLNAGVTDAHLLAALHPTAAVGGYPKQNTRRAIASVEAFDRGWYAAPVGWLARDSAEFAVAIRSAMLTKESLSLFAGAGILPGADADFEWNELEAKIKNFMKVLTDVHS